MAINKPFNHPDENLTCGECQWFNDGFSCSVERQVTSVERACMEFTKPLPDMAESLKTDKFLVKLRGAFQNPKFELPHTIIDELNRYMFDEAINFPMGTYQELEALATNLKRLNSYYARVGQISTYITDIKYDFEELHRKASMWLFTRYPVIRNLKNDTQRQAAFDAAIPESVAISVKLRKANAVAETVDAKLTRSTQALKAILNTSEKVYAYKESLPRGNTRL